MMLHLPQNIRLIRLLSGKTQTEFGKIFKASKAMIVSYEKGKANPDELFISRLSNFCGVTEHDLLNKKLTEADIKQKEEKVEKEYSNLPPKETEASTVKVGEADIQNLIISNLKMIDTMLSDARSREADGRSREIDAKIRESLTQTNNELVKIIKDQIIADVPSRNQKDVDSMRRAFLELLGQIGSGKRWKSPEEVRTVYRKLVADAMGLTKQKDIQKGSGKLNISK